MCVSVGVNKTFHIFHSQCAQRCYAEYVQGQMEYVLILVFFQCSTAIIEMKNTWNPRHCYALNTEIQEDTSLL